MLHMHHSMDVNCIKQIKWDTSVIFAMKSKERSLSFFSILMSSAQGVFLQTEVRMNTLR